MATLRSSNIILPDILGWPGSVSGDPDGSLGGQSMTDQILRSMPVAYLQPMQQHGELGLEIFTLQPAWDEYSYYLGTQEIDVGNNKDKLKVMYQDISPMSETYTNTYSPSDILSSVSGGLGGVAGELLYITGKNIDQNIESLTKSKNALVSGAAGAAKDFLDTAESAVGGLIGGNAGTRIAHQMREALVKGQKIDFPMMWKGSSFAASYDLSIRFYNPSPASDYYYGNLILGPLAAILALTLPKTAIDLTNPSSEQDLTYQWPFLLKFTIPGLVNLDAAYISNVSVVKGGDVNDRAWNNRPNIIDIRMTISSLYNTMLMTPDKPKKSQQPVLLTELENLYQKKLEIEPSTIGSPSPFVDESLQPTTSNNSPISPTQNTTPGRFNLSPAQQSAGSNLQ